jgi:hypothetical protein
MILDAPQGGAILVQFGTDPTERPRINHRHGLQGRPKSSSHSLQPTTLDEPPALSFGLGLEESGALHQAEARFPGPEGEGSVLLVDPLHGPAGAEPGRLQQLREWHRIWGGHAQAGGLDDTHRGDGGHRLRCRRGPLEGDRREARRTDRPDSSRARRLVRATPPSPSNRTGPGSRFDRACPKASASVFAPCQGSPAFLRQRVFMGPFKPSASGSESFRGAVMLRPRMPRASTASAASPASPQRSGT